MDGTKATGVVSQILSMGRVVSLGDDVMITDKCVWCFVLDKKRLAEISHSYPTKTVNYCPHPLIAISSSAEPFDKQTLLIISSKEVSAWVERFSNHMVHRGFNTVHKVSSELTMRETVRLCKGASFVIYDSVESSDPVYPCISLGTPFFMFNTTCTESLGNILRLSNLRELVSYATSYEQLKSEIYEVYINGEKASSLLRETSRNMKNVMSWVKKDKVSMERGKGPVFVKTDMNNFSKVILTPWIGIIDSFSEVPASLESPEFLVSSLTCIRVLVYNEEIAKRVPSSVESFVVRPMVIAEPPFFDVSAWNKVRNMALIGNNIILGSMTTPKTVTVDRVPANTVVVLSSPDTPTREKWIRWCMSKRVPIVLRCCGLSDAFLTDDYPLYLEDLSPNTVINACTESSLRDSLSLISSHTYSDADEYVKSI